MQDKDRSVIRDRDKDKDEDYLDKIRRLNIFAEEIRLETLKAFGKLGFGHVGGSMSVIELLAALYGSIMNIRPEEPKWDGRDWLVMSKGHAGPALYATLALKGYFPLEDLMTLNCPKTNLPSHCDMNKTAGVDMTTGSLGQGMSAALGIALGNRLLKKESIVYLVLGDGECDEGQVWEGALFAAHNRIGNLIAFVDKNRQQLDGYTDDVMGLGDLTGKFIKFGWHTQEINGENIGEICAAVAEAKKVIDLPHMIILNTVKGKGCTYAEGVLYNHHVTVSAEQNAEALVFSKKRLAELAGK